MQRPLYQFYENSFLQQSSALYTISQWNAFLIIFLMFFRLALRLDRPRQAKKLLTKLKTSGDLENAVNKLDMELKNVLFRFVAQWNTIGGASCELAQAVLQILLMDYLSVDKSERPYQVDARQLAAVLSYSDKHYRRLDKLHSRISVVDLLLKEM